MTTKQRSLFAGCLMLLAVQAPAQIQQPGPANETIKTVKMKEYMLMIRLPLAYGSAEASEVRAEWNQLTDKWKADGIFVTSFVFPVTGYVISGAEKEPKNEPVVANGTKVISTIVVRAEDYRQANHLGGLCPILKQGGTVEVREIAPR